MSNIIQIKRGLTKPGQNVLAPFELGYILQHKDDGTENEDDNAGKLVIGGLNGSPLDLKVDSADSADSADIAEKAKALVNDSGEVYTAGSATVPVYLENGVVKPCSSEDVSLGMTVEAAERLSTPRAFRTNLASTSSVNFDGTGNVTPGVTGTLPITNGGTGVNTEAALKRLILNMAYPIGSIYMSTTNNSPATFLGGTWVQITDTFLLAAGSTYTAGGTGGAATVTLTQAQTPLKSHTHTPTVDSASFLIRPPGNEDRNITSAVSNTTIETGPSNWTYGINTAVTANARPEKVTVSPTVSIANASNTTASAHNNMPPYLTVYMWKRTA